MTRYVVGEKDGEEYPWKLWTQVLREPKDSNNFMARKGKGERERERH